MSKLNEINDLIDQLTGMLGCLNELSIESESVTEHDEIQYQIDNVKSRINELRMQRVYNN